MEESNRYVVKINGSIVTSYADLRLARNYLYNEVVRRLDKGETLVKGTHEHYMLSKSGDMNVYHMTIFDTYKG